MSVRYHTVTISLQGTLQIYSTIAYHFRNFSQRRENEHAMFVQWLGMSEINKDDVTLSVISHYKSMGSPPARAYSQWFYFLKSTAGILMRDERLVSASMKYEGHVTTAMRPPVSEAARGDEMRNQASLLRCDDGL